MTETEKLAEQVKNLTALVAGNGQMAPVAPQPMTPQQQPQYAPMMQQPFGAVGMNPMMPGTMPGMMGGMMPGMMPGGPVPQATALLLPFAFPTPMGTVFCYLQYGPDAAANTQGAVNAVLQSPLGQFMRISQSGGNGYGGGYGGNNGYGGGGGFRRGGGGGWRGGRY